MYKQTLVEGDGATNCKQLFCYATQTGWFVSSSLETVIQKTERRVVPAFDTVSFGYLDYKSNSGRTVIEDCSAFPLRFHWPQWVSASRPEITIDAQEGNKEEPIVHPSPVGSPASPAVDLPFPVIGGRLAEMYLTPLASELGIEGHHAVAATVIYLANQKCFDRVKNFTDVALRDAPSLYAPAVELFSRCHLPWCASSEHRAPRA